MSGSGDSTIPSESLTTFSVAAVIETMAQQYGINVECVGMDDDLCFGLVVSSDSPFTSFLQQHALAYDYLIADGDPIRLIRRAVNADLTIDAIVDQEDCIAAPGAASVKITRADPMSLPREVEVQYIDPDRAYAVNTQIARHLGVPITAGKLSLALAFVLSADQARAMAFDTLYRIWGQQNTYQFETRDLRFEPGDALSLVMENGKTHTILVTDSVVTQARTNQITARNLLVRKGITIAGGTVEPTAPFDSGGS